MESGEVERELEELETRIERLRALYEQYFMGIERIEPVIPRKDVDRRVWVLRREQIRNTGLRFKFQMLIQRYNTFQQYWGRITREIENGTYRRDVVRAAKRIGAQEALTIVGRKRAERYAVLAEQQEAANQAATRRATGADADEYDVDDSAVTLRPPPGRVGAAMEESVLEVEPDEAADAPDERAAGPLAAKAAHHAQSDLARRQPPPLAAVLPPPVEGAAPVKPAPLGGLPWGIGLPKPPQPKQAAPAADPTKPARSRPGSSPQPEAAEGAPRRRLAELTAEMRAKRTQTAPGEAKLSGKPEADAPTPSPTSGASKRRSILPPTAEPTTAKRRSVLPPAAEPAVTKRRSVLPPAAEPATAKRRSVLPPAAEPAVTRRRRSTKPPPSDGDQASGVRGSGSGRSSRPPRTPEGMRPGPEAQRSEAQQRPKAAPPPQRPAARTEDLPEQRLRQIYAKYVETKRAANESTAGVTYERLAESLRAQAAKLRANNPARSVDYDVVVKDGKTLLKPILK